MLVKVISFITMLLFSSTAFAQEAEEQAAKQFIAGIGDSVVSIFEKYDDDNLAKRETALTKLFDESIDSAWMGRFVMGRYWRQASNKQQREFQELYKEFLFINYLPHFKNYSGEKQVVKGLVDEGDGDYLVRTQIVRPTKNTPVNVDYRVHRTGQKTPFQIFDIVTEGVSVVTTHRSDFGSVIAQDGIDGLIKRIRSKVHTLKNSS